MGDEKIIPKLLSDSPKLIGSELTNNNNNNIAFCPKQVGVG
jgi:hypothetical protein